MATEKGHLPSKTCAACGRPFSWRKKWKQCWEQVRYCSAACRSGKGPTCLEPGDRPR
ncbi:DUF2256 domain-containing protein [Fimbriiglobus ruber]|uniref:DUF2256 domain-containing protein n=1 Tax=Fimbriiglobus ruber TaxID=1908690 RepID=UPI000B4B4F41|nr:DUF2256 domain-containing protein [Fimbriiglobus ruber]